MKTIPLRQLVREPIKVKKWTHAGQTVHVTDNGNPLWVIRAAAPGPQEEEQRRRAIDEVLDQVIREQKSSVSLSKIIKESRR